MGSREGAVEKRMEWRRRNNQEGEEQLGAPNRYVGMIGNQEGKIYLQAEDRAEKQGRRDKAGKGHIRGQRSENNIEDRAALRCRSDPGRKG